MSASKLTGLAFIFCQLAVIAVMPSAVRAGDPQRPATAPRITQLAAANLLAIEQMDAEFVATADVIVQQQPTTQSRGLARLSAGSPVQVTGLVTGADWYRVIIASGEIGYVESGALRPLAEGAAPPAASKGKQTAAVTAPPVPAVKSPAKPAVGVFGLPPGMFRDCPRCPQMVPVPPGSYTMGSNNGDSTEQPVHEVAIRHSYAIGKYEVTVAEWMACVTVGGCNFEPATVGSPERTPLRNVSWDDVQQYLGWLNQVTGKAYRLPSEAEWEYAARGGTQTNYWWGEQGTGGRANCKDCGGLWDRKAPAEIGSYPANPFGLHDMNGGVAEWTGDCWVKNYHKAPDDGSVRDKAGCQQRVLRGGSWRDDVSYLGSASRHYYDASVRYVVNGFRIALILE